MSGDRAEATQEHKKDEDKAKAAESLRKDIEHDPGAVLCRTDIAYMGHHAFKLCARWGHDPKKLGKDLMELYGIDFEIELERRMGE